MGGAKLSYDTPKQLDDPQEAINTFWSNFTSRKPGFVRHILAASNKLSSSSAFNRNPEIVEGRSIPQPQPQETSSQQQQKGQQEYVTYAAARAACIRRVRTIVRECKRKNEKFTDAEFDVFADFHYREASEMDCLHGLPVPTVSSTKLPPPPPPNLQDPLAEQGQPFLELKFLLMSERRRGTRGGEKGGAPLRTEGKGPQSVHRVDEIFEKPILAPNAKRSNLGDLNEVSSEETRWGRCKQKVLRSYRAVSSRHRVTIRWSLWISLAAVLAFRLFDLITLQSLTRLVLLNITLFLLLRLDTRIQSSLSGPQFSSSEMKQSDSLGNCWWLSAVATLTARNELLQRLFVAWDQDCGVYGFVFYRGGGWIYTVIDDLLYLSYPNFHGTVEGCLDRFGGKLQIWKNGFQKGSDALYFAQCQSPNQTWLPLLEKAYAKVHGDYDAIAGGCAAEGLEDLTGGVCSSYRTDGVLAKEEVWKQLRQKDTGDYVYALHTPPEGANSRTRGLTLQHAYSVEGAYWYFDIHRLKWVRLLRIRNPWGSKDGVWEGAWGPCSKEWTSLWATWWLRPYARQEGAFYMTFDDAIATFEDVERIRLFDERVWQMKQSWVKIDVPWVPEYSPIYFSVSVTKPGNYTFSLSQLEDRYFFGLQGRYVFHLDMLIRKKVGEEDDPSSSSSSSSTGDFIAHAKGPDDGPLAPYRSVSIEKDLEPGTYEVLVKITALVRGTQNIWSVEDMVRQSTKRPRKLQQIARNYDAAHSKLQIVRRWGLERPPRSRSCPSSRASCVSSLAIVPSSGATSMRAKPEDVAWNAVCGVGLRVFGKDEGLSIELHHRDEGTYSRSRSRSTSGTRTPRSSEYQSVKSGEVSSSTVEDWLSTHSVTFDEGDVAAKQEEGEESAAAKTPVVEREGLLRPRDTDADGDGDGMSDASSIVTSILTPTDSSDGMEQQSQQRDDLLALTEEVDLEMQEYERRKLGWIGY